MTDDGEMLSTLATENERLRIELAEWKAAAGWSAEGFGPQTAAEVAVFQREADRVNGHVTAFEIAKLRAEVGTTQAALEEAKVALRVVLKENGDERTAHEATKAHLSRSMQGELDALAEIARLKKDVEFETDCLEATLENGKTVCQQRDQTRTDLQTAQATAKEALQNLDESEEEVTKLKQQLERYSRRSDRNRRFAFLWKQHAKNLTVSGRALERATGEAAGALEQWNDASKQLMAQYKRDQQAHAVYRESAEDCMRTLQAALNEWQGITGFTDAGNCAARIRELVGQLERAQPILTACEAVPEYARKGLVMGMPWLGELYEAINAWLEPNEAAAEEGLSLPAPEVRQRGVLRRLSRVECPPIVLEEEGPEEPDAEGVVEALEDTAAHIENCLAAGDKLDALLEIVAETEAAIDARSESPAEAAHRQSVAYARMRGLIQDEGERKS